MRSEAGSESEKENLKLTACAEVLLKKQTSNIDEESLSELGTHKQKDLSNVRLGNELNNSQSGQLQALPKSHDKVFLNVPRRMSKIEHKIKLVDKEPVRAKLCSLRYAFRKKLKNEITEMLDI